jgi:hypothetical protein
LPAPATGEWTQRVSQVRALTPNNVWIAGWAKQAPDGGQIRRSLILHWNGHAWTNSPVPGSPPPMVRGCAECGRSYRQRAVSMSAISRPI